MKTLRDAERYVGMVYDPNTFDCADLAVLVQSELFGRTVPLPTGRSRPGGRRGQVREIRRWREALAAPAPAPETGIAVLMFDFQDGASAGARWHVGTVFLGDAGEVWVLHNSATMGGAALQRLRDLQNWGLSVEGFYAWK